MQVQVNMVITQENLSNWFCGAFEGGSNYWLALNVREMNRKNFKQEQSLDDNLSESFFKDDNFSFKVYDVQSDDDEWELLGEVNWDNIKWALQHMSVHYPNLFNDLVHGDADADSCDVWLQLASMKDVVFG